MIEETGKIVEVEGAFAWIESERTSTCGGCTARNGCGTAVIAKLLGKRRLRLRVVNQINARVGDNVVIGISESGLLRGSLAVYAVPLLGLFIGALIGAVLNSQFFPAGSDTLSIVGAAAGFAAGLGWLKRFSRATGADTAYQPVVLRQQIRVHGS